MMHLFRQTLIAAMLLMIMIGKPSAATAELMLSTGVAINSFSDDLAPQTDGSEFTVPISLKYTRGDRFSVRFDSGYSRAQVNQPDGTHATLANLTDTLLSASYAIFELPARVSCGVTFNLPTGKERLTPKEIDATIGENNDLFEVEQFGEGLNVGMNFSLIKQIGKVVVGLNGLYVYKGEYDPTAEMSDDDLDPGDQILLAGLTRWQPSAKFGLTMLATYSYFTEDQKNGVKDYQEGNTLTFSESVNYFRQPFGVVFSMQQVLPQKDREVINGSLSTEPANSNSNTLLATLTGSYVYSQKFVLELVGDIRYYSESDRTDPANALPYSGKRIRYSVGPGVIYAINKYLSCSVRLNYIRMNDDKDIYMKQDRVFQGVNGNFEMSYLF